MQTASRKGNDEKKSMGNRFPLVAILLSVLSALVLWFYVQDVENPDYKRTFSAVPVEIQSLSSSFSVIDGADLTVDITLRGKRSDINKIRPDEIEVSMDLGQVYQPGVHRAELNIMVPEGTELEKCFPQVATVFVDRTATVTVPVRVETGKYTVGDAFLEVTPAVTAVTVKGPESVLDKIDCAKVLTGDLGNITSSFESNFSYDLYDENGKAIDLRYVVLPERSIKLRFSVYKTKTVSFTVQCKNGWWSAAQMDYSITPATVLVKGEPALVDALTEVPAVILDETQIDTTNYTATITPDRLPLPAGITLAETVGDIKVQLTLKDNSSRNLRMRYSDPHVTVTSPAPGLEYQFAEQELSFRIRGAASAVREASADDFYLHVDLSEFTAAGEYQVPVEIVQTSATLGRFYPVGSYTVTVRIS